MRDIKEKLNTSILLITHDLGVVAEMADYVVVMYAGKVIEEAPVLELLKILFIHIHKVYLNLSHQLMEMKLDFIQYQDKFLIR